MLFAIAFLGAAEVESSEPRPVTRKAKEVAEMLSQRKFHELEKLAAALRKKSVPLSDGQPALSGFYAGVSKCVAMNCGDENLTDQEWLAHKTLLDKWNATLPKSTTAKLALALFQKEYGWYARGVGFANTVSGGQWKLFNERLAASNILLESIRHEAKNDPAWYVGMLEVSQAQNWPRAKFDEFYAKSIKRFPYYLPLYFSKLLVVSPKWGGSLAEFRAFVANRSARRDHNSARPCTLVSTGPSIIRRCLKTAKLTGNA